MLNSTVLGIGALLTLAECGVVGWLAHRWLLDHAPGVAALIPRDGGAVAGFIAGAVAIAL